VPEEVPTEEQKPEAEPEITVEVQSDRDEEKGRPQLSDEQVEKMDTAPPDDEIARYAKDAQKRIKSLFTANQEWRRRVVQSQKDVATATDLAQKLYNENQDLKKNVQRSESALIDQALQRAESQLAAAKQRAFQALTSQTANPQAIIDAQEEMARAVAEADRLRLLKPASPNGEAEEPPPPSPQQQMQQQAPASAATQAWVQRNPWFQANAEMRNYAMSVHEALANQGVTEQNGTAYWGAIDQEMRKRYPEQFGLKMTEPKEATRPVAVTGTTRTNTNGAPSVPKNPRHVVLSESQVRIANSLGISPEEYAKAYVKYEAENAKGATQ